MERDMDAIGSFNGSSRFTDSSDDNDDDEPAVIPLADNEAAKAAVSTDELATIQALRKSPRRSKPGR
ncbi:hypothetical protein PF005_g18116 [Phytophthora fragariae]|uniref:Uncharacterized protein n=1 Tax=Phytophthora fragariae TaxID=53985 RepID=A0A6A3SNL3_9STRA|nr:hypothetical protein PF007_g8093 [Phytophthora fragariae]KAE9193335.1 hypothetical protein PF005_g18116 [Phytophthora fragariae]KAE9193575.1 hypothetical protein PF004_g20981 [Phytophthora fragariae]KAE9286503.1 hypothetical protein PF001_g21411 [Phytophthora fragariae]